MKIQLVIDNTIEPLLLDREFDDIIDQDILHEILPEKTKLELVIDN